GLAWQASRGQRHLFLVGSLHVGTEGLYPLPQAITDAFDEADVLVAEIDLFAAKRPENIALMTQSASYGAGETLDQHLRPEVRELFRKSPLAARFGPAAQNLRPWFLSVAATMQTLESAGYLSSLGIDQHFA